MYNQSYSPLYIHSPFPYMIPLYNPTNTQKEMVLNFLGTIDPPDAIPNGSFFGSYSFVNN